MEKRRIQVPSERNPFSVQQVVIFAKRDREENVAPLEFFDYIKDETLGIGSVRSDKISIQKYVDYFESDLYTTSRFTGDAIVVYIHSGREYYLRQRVYQSMIEKLRALSKQFPDLSIGVLQDVTSWKFLNANSDSGEMWLNEKADRYEDHVVAEKPRTVVGVTRVYKHGRQHGKYFMHKMTI